LGLRTRSQSFRTSDGRSVTLRPLAPRDAPALVGFANAMAEEKKVNRDLGVVSFDRRATTAEEKRFLSETLKGMKRKETVSVAAFDGNRLVGHCDIRRRMRDDVMHAGTLGITVLDGYRGVGLGEKLMSEALLRAWRRGIRLVQLTVFSNNSVARALYGKMGFREVGVIPGKVVRDGKPLDEVIMYAEFRRTDKSTPRPRQKS